RSSIDALASWIGDGTIGVLLTSKQYEDGFYTKREAAVIGTTFSVVSITFSLVVISEFRLFHICIHFFVSVVIYVIIAAIIVTFFSVIRLSYLFFPFYITVVISGIIAAIIMPRIPPLSLKKDTDIHGNAAQVDETAPAGENMVTFGYRKAIERSRKETSVYKFFKEGSQNVLDMWMGVAPIVMGFGLIALIIAEYTPVFAWLGAPFVPLLEVMQVPYAAEASETLLVGFADMFLPSVIGASIEAEMTRFIVAA